MFLILYNPLSNKGNFKKNLLKVEKILSRKKEKYDTVNLLDINGKEKEFITNLDISTNLVIVGGDGTIHQVINRVKGIEIKNKVFFYQGGRGNDFSRGHKGKFFEITNEIKALPLAKFNEKEIIFLNGIGMGVDAKVCEAQILNAKNNIKESYFKCAIRIFKNFKPYSLDIEIDNKKMHFDNVWFFTIQNGKYFGGGMKIAPNAIRDDNHLDLWIVHKVKLAKLFLLFPLIFIGKHKWFKRVGIEEIYGENFVIDTVGCSIVQHDGEVNTDVRHLEVHRFW